MVPAAFRSLVAMTVLLGAGLLGLGSAAAETPRIATAAERLHHENSWL
jgi:hypothetical protein